MTIRLNPFNKSKNRIFLARELPSVLIITVLGILGEMYGKLPLGVLAAFIVITILRSDAADAFCWSLVLIPNIRLLDDLGAEFIVNIMLALPILVYLFRQGTKNLPLMALAGSIILFMMEIIHNAILDDLDGFVSIAGWTLNFCLCMLVTVDHRVKLSKNDVFSALTTGVILSAVVYLGSGQDTIKNIIDSMNHNVRLQAYAHDPNYYSLYICLSIACVLNVKGYNIYKFVVLALLTGIGLLTASKMCMLLMAFEYVLIFLQIFNRNKENKSNRKFLLWGAAGILALGYMARDYIVVIFDNFMRRAGLEANQTFDLDRLTTGRLGIAAEYIQILGNNIACLLFGYGFNYYNHLNHSSANCSHNTYLDVLLTWGLVGVLVFGFIITLWLQHYRASRNITKISVVRLIPLIVLLINFLDLSCLSAGMFPFVLTVAVIQWIPDYTEKEVIKNEI